MAVPSTSDSYYDVSYRQDTEASPSLSWSQAQQKLKPIIERLTLFVTKSLETQHIDISTVEAYFAHGDPDKITVVFWKVLNKSPIVLTVTEKQDYADLTVLKEYTSMLETPYRIPLHPEQEDHATCTIL